jgi:hypothetical protein
MGADDFDDGELAVVFPIELLGWALGADVSGA